MFAETVIAPGIELRQRHGVDAATGGVDALAGGACFVHLGVQSPAKPCG